MKTDWETVLVNFALPLVRDRKELFTNSQPPNVRSVDSTCEAFCDAPQEGVAPEDTLRGSLPCTSLYHWSAIGKNSLLIVSL